MFGMCGSDTVVQGEGHEVPGGMCYMYMYLRKQTSSLITRNLCKMIFH